MRPSASLEDKGLVVRRLSSTSDAHGGGGEISHTGLENWHTSDLGIAKEWSRAVEGLSVKDCKIEDERCFLEYCRRPSAARSHQYER